MKKRQKYIFVIGGVMSGVGKGVATSSLGKILQTMGFVVNPIKIDPYLNVDAGTMNPTEHGEVFVLENGLETDQDLGNYERFMEVTLGPEDYMTSGMVYKSVIDRERNLGYKGKCVEAVPHVIDEIKRRLKTSAESHNSDITLVEIGGTVGDFQNALFIEAARVMKMEHPNDVLFVMVSYLPVPGKIGEMKTKPTQNAVRLLNSYGVQPNIIIARSEVSLDKKRKEKIAVWCNINPKNIISAPDIESIYDVPINFERDKLGSVVLKELHLRARGGEGLLPWKKFVEKVHDGRGEVKIAIVGKYFDTGSFILSDAYISVIEAIKFSAYAVGKKPKIEWLDAKEFSARGGSTFGGEVKKNLKKLSQYDGVIVPGGFGESGIEGKISAIRFARENKIPYLGLCYGMQLMVIEYARNVAGLKDANTAEINPNAPYVVIDIMPDQKKLLAEKKYGGSMRLGSYPAHLKPGTVVYSAYFESESFNLQPSSSKFVYERHRHRYEVNPEYIQKIEDAGLIFSGCSPDGSLMEYAELPKSKHPFFVGTQAHPEFKAHPLSPHKLFTAFLQAASERSKNRGRK